MSAILSFYRDQATDAAGHSRPDILAWDDEQLEFVDDFIQWLFPTIHASQFVEDAPRLTADDIEAFQSDPELRRNLQQSLVRMLAFYGYTADFSPAPNHAERVDVWVTRYNHNFRRISRILESLHTLGLESEAASFFQALKELYRVHELTIGAQSFRYWELSVL